MLLKQVSVMLLKPWMVLGLIWGLTSGCATIVMSEYQEVEVVNIPKKTRFESPRGETYDLQEGRQILRLERSRENLSAKVYCAGSSKPKYKGLKTVPNLAFILGNILMAFPLGHIIDAFSDESWDYKEPVDLKSVCSSHGKRSNKDMGDG